MNRSHVTFLLAVALGVASATRVCGANEPVPDSAATSGYTLASLGDSNDSATAARPDSARKTWVKFALMQFDEVRILARGEKIEALHPLPTSDGFLIRDHAVPGWNSLMADPRKPYTVRWGEIEQIQARKHRGGMGILLGALAGLGVGLSISMALAFDSRFSLATAGDVSAPVVLGIVGGGALGALIDRPGPWETIYP